jgi:dihydroorotate dehydrogenase (NAD+) catalytic subunit
MNMKVDLGRGLCLPNPILVASGTFGYGTEYEESLDLSRLGAIVVKGLSLNPRAGNTPPRLAETPAGLINSIGLQNIGVSAFIKEKLPALRDLGARVIANVYAERVDEFVEICGLLGATPGIAALELNISCPNVNKGGLAFGSDPETAHEVTGAVRRATPGPLVVKLSPNVGDITQIAAAVAEAGADAVSLINTMRAMAIDVETRTSKIGNIIGGLSGPAIKPVAVRMVWEVARKVSIPVIGIGGITSAADALEFILAGARAVQIGTANFYDPAITLKILAGLEDYGKRHRLENLSSLVGGVRV